MEEWNRGFYEGWQAHEEGKRLDASPYAFDTPDHEGWAAGWNTCQAKWESSGSWIVATAGQEPAAYWTGFTPCGKPHWATSRLYARLYASRRGALQAYKRRVRGGPAVQAIHLGSGEE